MKLHIFRKIPKLNVVAPVYAVIVVILYYPTILHFFWKLPSWLLFSSLGDLFNIYCYMVTVDFLESLLMLLGVVGLCIILPRKWFYDHFISKGALLTILILGYFIFLGTRMQPEMDFPWSLVRLTPLFLLLIMLIVFVLDQVGFVRKILEEIANRLVIFLYILIPLSVLGVIVVLARNVS